MTETDIGSDWILHAHLFSGETAYYRLQLE